MGAKLCDLSTVPEVADALPGALMAGAGAGVQCALPLPEGRMIGLADYPLLREIAWSTDPAACVSPDEAFALYERNWRFLDVDAMGSEERALLAHLTATVGNGVLLV